MKIWGVCVCCRGGATSVSLQTLVDAAKRGDKESLLLCENCVALARTVLSAGMFPQVDLLYAAGALYAAGEMASYAAAYRVVAQAASEPIRRIALDASAAQAALTRDKA